MEEITEIDKPLTFGAFRGKTLIDIANFQPSYIDWLYKEELVSRSLVSKLYKSRESREPMKAFNQASRYAEVVDNLNKLKGKTKMNKNTFVNNIKQESVDMAQVTAGKVIYKTAIRLLEPVLPTFKWYEKLVTSKAKREAITMVTVYVLLHLVRTKLDHYALESLTAYMNYELQGSLLDQFAKGINLEEMLKMPEFK